jgi:hypothetical protein|tara:strand:- start:254 stop:403 length:150 start_codon:yes stop_codon:yes gene_type:complete
MALTLDINLSVGRAGTGSGAPPNVPNLVILTEASAFMQTEDGFFLEFEF